MWNSWVMEGSASVSSFATQYATGFLTSVLIGQFAIAGAASLSAAVMATLQVPTFAVIGSFVLTLKNVGNWFSFKCEDTVGCWPDKAIKNATAMGHQVCRMPPKSQQGGSTIWFMPPPMTRTRFTGNGGCVLDSCSNDQWRLVSVGLQIHTSKRFGKPLIENCQPLSWEDMTLSQKKLYLTKIIASGIEAEYDLTKARIEASMEDFALPGLAVDF
jgi:hypothetical protein